jgi:hypothetical protein
LDGASDSDTFNFLSMSDDLCQLIERLRHLVEDPGDEPGAVEHTLTDGYARALALEAERRRAEARVRELAGDAESLDEQRVLKIRLDQIDGDLAALRGLLDALAATLKTPA